MRWPGKCVQVNRFAMSSPQDLLDELEASRDCLTLNLMPYLGVCGDHSRCGLGSRHRKTRDATGRGDLSNALNSTLALRDWSSTERQPRIKTNSMRSPPAIATENARTYLG